MNLRNSLRGLAIVTCLVVAAIFPATASAAIAEATTSCQALINAFGDPYLCLSENGSDGSGDKLTSTAGSDHSNLAAKAHTLGGTCNSVVRVGDNWNDCISFAAFSGDSTDWACLYEDANYGHLIGWLHDGQANTYAVLTFSGTGNNDDVSSIKVVTNTTYNPC